MNENNAEATQAAPEPGPPQGTAPGAESYGAPQATPAASPTPEPFLSRLRRSRNDQMIGGVSGGLSRETGIDPLIFRVAFVAASFAGGAGVILYLAAWMFIPEEGSDIGGIGKEFKAKDDVQVRTIGMVAAAVIAALAAIGSGPWFFSSWANGSSWVVIALGLVAGLLYWIFSASKGQTMSTGQFSSPPPPPPAAGTNPGTAWTAAPSSTPPPPIPPKPREPGGLVLFGLTVSIGAIALGALALWASATEPLDPRVYLATAVAITAVGTLVGIRWGRPGPVITLGTILSTVLVASSLIPSVSMGAINLEPTSVREIRQPVSLGMGEIQIDLRQVSPETSLNGHTLNVTNGIGRIEVIVPEDVDVEVNASVRVGHINALGLERGGNTFQLGNNNNLVHEADGPNPLVINAATNIGEVQVIRK